MKDKYKPSQWEAPKKFWYMTLSLISIVILCVFIGAMIKPDWEIYEKYPWIHQLIAYFLLIIIGGLTIFNFFLVIHLIWSNFKLEDRNKELKEENVELNLKIQEYDKELVKIRNS